MTGIETRGLPLLGLMLGDCTGIGPEQCARVLADRRLADAARLLVVGDARVLEQGARHAGVSVAWRSYAAPEDVDWSRTEIPIIDLGNLDPSTLPRGAVSAESGRISGETLATMVDLALEGRIDGITFAPLNKAALHAGGWRFRMRAAPSMRTISSPSAVELKWSSTFGLRSRLRTFRPGKE